MNAETLDIIRTSRTSILADWVTLEKTESYFIDGMLTADELDGQSSQLLTALIGKLSNDRNDQADRDATEILDDHLNTLALQWAKLGFSSRDTFNFISNLKITFLLFLKNNITEPELLYSESRKVDKLMDRVGINVFETFIRGREGEIRRQVQEITDIRTPIIEMWKGIVALPIIGTLDSSRTQEVMDELLRRIAKDNIEISIIDISGVPMIDSTVAQHLSQLVKAVRLLGAECIISGIRPEIATTIVHLGIDMSGMTTRASLADALRIAFRKRNLEVMRRTRAAS